MSIQNYVRQIEKYIEDEDSKGKSLDSARGLLSPRSIRKTETSTKKGMEPMQLVMQFVYDLRKKRNEFKNKKAK